MIKIASPDTSWSFFDDLSTQACVRLVPGEASVPRRVSRRGQLDLFRWARTPFFSWTIMSPFFCPPGFLPRSGWLRVQFQDIYIY